MSNLINDPHLPVIRASGTEEVVRPADITSQYAQDPIVALAYARPDYNGAMTEFLIGLLAVALPLSEDEWLSAWDEPPDQKALELALEPLSFAFELFGGGARCFQDLDSLESVKANPPRQLLIDAPGANTVKLNQDFFIRRRPENDILSWQDAAAALITLQTYAPAGGAGHRTSMRGGGPLTTLVRPRRKGKRPTLWGLVHANRPVEEGAAPFDASVFPWLGDTRVSINNEVTTPTDVHPYQGYFGMPRRIRLEGSENGVTGFRTVARGTNYAGWQHPLSPYYKDKKGELLPLHPREGTPTLRDFPSAWGLSGQAASAVSQFMALNEAADLDWDLLAFGYDMDNAKASGWTQLQVPALRSKEQGERAQVLVDAAGEAAYALRTALRRLVFGSVSYENDKAKITIAHDAPKGAFSERILAFELVLEPTFLRLLADLGENDASYVEVNREWLSVLRKTALAQLTEVMRTRRMLAEDAVLAALATRMLKAAFSDMGKGGKVAVKLGIQHNAKEAV
jgi:CRISPR system Cascade subunit CasA